MEIDYKDIEFREKLNNNLYNPIFKDGVCKGCSTETRVTSLCDIDLCEQCFVTVKRQILESEKNLKFVSKIDESIIDTMININEYYVYLDMDKIWKDVKASPTAKGNFEKYVLDKYGVIVDAIKDDRIDFRNGQLTSRNNKLNQLLIDYDGEFMKDDQALKLTPDMDGTMAPLKVRGKGIISPTGGQATVATPVKQTPTATKVAIPAKQNTPITGLPDDENIKVGEYIATVVFKGQDTNYYDINISIPGAGGTPVDDKIGIVKYKGVGGKEVLCSIIVGNIGTLTANKMMEGYTFSLFGVTFTAEVKNIHIEQALADVIYYVKDINNTTKVNVIPRVVKSLRNIENDLKSTTEQYLRDYKFIPLDFSFTLAKLKIEGKFNRFSNNDFVFIMTGSNGGTFPLAVNMDDYRKHGRSAVAEALSNNLANLAKEVSHKFIITLDPQTKFQAIMTVVSILDNKLVYYVSDDSGKQKNLTVEIKDYRHAEEEITQAIKDEISSNPNATITKEKAKILKSKGNAAKEIASRKIADEIERTLRGSVSGISIDIDFNVNSKNEITSIVFTFFDNDEMDVSVNAKIAIESFRDCLNNVLDALVDKKQKETDSGIDDTGKMYIKFDVTDSNTIEAIIQKFKLNESMGWKSVTKNKKVEKLFEEINLKRIKKRK